jgi:hypothetical protein
MTLMHLTLFAIVFVVGTLCSNVVVDAASGTVYKRVCNTKGEDCKYSSQPAGCHKDRASKGLLIDTVCSNQEGHCAFKETYDNDNCTGTPKHTVLQNICNYCQQDYGGGVMGIYHMCNATMYTMQVCNDYACGICPAPYGYWTFGECSSRKKTVRRECGYLYAEQYFQGSCGNSEYNGVGPQEWYTTPYVQPSRDRITTIQCTPFKQ